MHNALCQLENFLLLHLSNKGTYTVESLHLNEFLAKCDNAGEKTRVSFFLVTILLNLLLSAKTHQQCISNYNERQ